MKVFSVFFLLSLLFNANVNGQKIGDWGFTNNGLPVYHYKSKIPFTALDNLGGNSNLPEDPYFLLGNYRMVLITHASGVYQFQTAERAWARLNANELQPNYGANSANITFKNGNTVALTGINSIASNANKVQKTFGVGFAKYTYELENQVVCNRIISVKPSMKINTGNPSFIITVILKNEGKKTQSFTYKESMLVNFVMNGLQYTDKDKRPITYYSTVKIAPNQKIAIADINYKKQMFLNIPQKDQRYIYDVTPPSVFMYTSNEAKNYQSSVSENNSTLITEVSGVLKPGETKTFDVVIGVGNQADFESVEMHVKDLMESANSAMPTDGLFTNLWKSRLPDFSDEKDDILRRELYWNAHVVEASAKYSSYFNETFIPQGTLYSYHFGDNISNRDHLQALLPTCYTNPELAKSAIKFVIKHSDLDGEIKRGDTGFGYFPPSYYKESDEQLYFFNTISEYLLITKDYNFLNEKVAYYPTEYGKTDSVITMLKKYFVFLRDDIGTGPNGLVKMLNSDWSDSFFHKYSPNVYIWTAESYLNSAMVLSSFPKLIKALQQADNQKNAEFISALESYRLSIEKAFMKELDGRKFSPRAYLSSQLKFGVDNVCIEPQGYLLQIPNISKERKKEMYDYIKSKIITPEKIGARTREKPLWDGKPDGEDGGIWFSLEYPLLLGVATFDEKEAWNLMQKFSFDNFAKQYPNYWVGQWTAADEVNSTLYRPGLYASWAPVKDKSKAFQGYCSHPHTWPIFCYFKLKELEKMKER